VLHPRVLTSSQRTTSGGLIIVGVMEIIVPLIAVVALDAVLVLVVILDPDACILGMINVLNVSFALTLVVLHLGG
jgi:hypothetical protein